MQLATENLPTTKDLTNLALFQGESPDTLEWLLDYSEMINVSAGEILLSPGETNEYLLMILDGNVRIQLDPEDKNEIAYLQAGQCIGEMSIIEREKVSAYAIADTDCRILKIEGTILWSLINRSHAIACNLLFILSSRVRKNNHLVIESLNQQKIYEEFSKIDVLTNLHNRRWLDEVMDSIVDRCRINSEPLSVIMIDVDHFKKYNDINGHLAGDMALRAVSKSIQEFLRPSDGAARFGGEEFVVLLPNTNLKSAKVVAERLREGVRSTEIFDNNHSALPGVTVSVGVTSMEPNQTVMELLASADSALYRAKNSGRDCVVLC
jgi:diguanylate cyclase (GGDEF)-like protein